MEQNGWQGERLAAKKEITILKQEAAFALGERDGALRSLAGTASQSAEQREELILLGTKLREKEDKEKRCMELQGSLQEAEATLAGLRGELSVEAKGRQEAEAASVKARSDLVAAAAAEAGAGGAQILGLRAELEEVTGLKKALEAELRQTRAEYAEAVETAKGAKEAAAKEYSNLAAKKQLEQDEWSRKERETGEALEALREETAKAMATPGLEPAVASTSESERATSLGQVSESIITIYGQYS